MTVYHFEDVLVRVAPTGVVHVGAGQRVDVIDPLTSTTPAGLAQDGESVSYVTSNGNGLMAFEAEVGIVAASAPAVGFARTLIAIELYGAAPLGGGGPEAMGLSATPTWRLPWGQANGTASYLTGSLYCHPVEIPNDCYCDGIGVLCTTNGGGGGAAYGALYWDSGSYGPGGRACVTGSLDISTTGVKAGTFTEVLIEAGVYWPGLLVSAGTGQAFEKLAQVAGGSSAANPSPWLVNPHGTGSTPSVSTGNDGSVAIQTGLSGGTPPSGFAGSVQSDSNAPKSPPAVWLRLRSA